MLFYMVIGVILSIILCLIWVISTLDNVCKAVYVVLCAKASSVNDKGLTAKEVKEFLISDKCFSPQIIEVFTEVALETLVQLRRVREIKEIFSDKVIRRIVFQEQGSPLITAQDFRQRLIRGKQNTMEVVYNTTDGIHLLGLSEEVEQVVKDSPDEVSVVIAIRY